MFPHLRKEKSKNLQGGFSLIELMVSLTIFSIVMTVAIGTLLVLIDANAKAQALSSAMTNLSFALDSMTRNIRTGKNFHCTSASSVSTSLPSESNQLDCSSGNTAIVFTPGFESTWRMAYRLNGTRIEQWIDKPGQDTWVPITSDVPPASVTVNSLRFILNGSEDNLNDNDVDQPRVSVFVSGTVQNGLENVTKFEVQSNVTQRVLNY